MSASALSPRFFIAVVVILLFCRLISWSIGKVGQPPVVGEMVAGVLLGPSLLGAVAPRLENELFPNALKPVLYIAGQIGLVAFMFQAGHEFRAHLDRHIARAAATVSGAGIVVPLAFGVLLAIGAHGRVNIFVDGVSPVVTEAFVGVALAITAFPMLARIITERGLSGTRYGSLALAAGAIDDVVAWCLLAGVLAVATGHPKPILVALGGMVVFGLSVYYAARPLLARTLRQSGSVSDGQVLVVVAVLFLAAWFTDEIGLYAVFGAFCVGMVMPRDDTAERAVGTISTSSRIIFLPMFFVYSGLNTRFGLLGKPALLLFSLFAVILAVAGKFWACWLAARLSGQDQATAVRLGTLMNARGLMQLIALNVGLQAGIINSELFTALVLVALVTTLMASPALTLLDRRLPVSEEAGSAEPDSQLAAAPA
ncbi:sodium/hydrogen exchanger [Catenulispora acidiphila DSM 44928]|uniref:Sodium/hydrogen exchanger n=1 Tax=Catenulispora acidiphila (strain DSM 44928 / JCM 14897 / NBRC 102108 / NRRL B-24433 / ID139908) TaxID=479433 RepID=C7QGC8_CATAD|nr:cation:proton antiporter [Catenulispora acidiphila]ACU72973.1 sodium/hydrogen exchanger [Catenulispora acidiphila DSM 44928]